MNIIKNTKLRKRDFAPATNHAQMLEKTKEILEKTQPNGKLFMLAINEVEDFDIKPPFEEYYCFHSNLFNKEGACLDAEISLRVRFEGDLDPYTEEREEVILKKVEFKLWKNEDEQIFLSPFQQSYLENIIEKKIELIY